MFSPTEIRLSQAGVNFQVRIPALPLSRWVDSYWVSSGTPQYHSERILADGTSVLIFNLGAPIHASLGEGVAEKRSSFFAGVNTGFANVFHGGDHTQAGIRFKPGGAYPFLRQPVAEFSNLTVETDLLGRPDLAELLDALGTEQQVEPRLHLLEAWMEACLRVNLSTDPRVVAALELLHANPHLRVEKLAEQLECSRQYLGRIFLAHTGASPKALQRTLRMNQTLQHLRPGIAPDWIGLAEQGQYFDQAHLIHEFYHFTGLSPVAFQQEADRQVGRMILR